MTTYGDKQEPGIITDVTSSAAVPTLGPAPSNVGLVGQADLANATNAADTGKVYQVTRASKAVEWFGPRDSSMLTEAVIDALAEGAYPVYVVATEENEVTGEDISSVASTSVGLDNAPLREGEDDITVNLDGVDLTTNRVYDDVTEYSPEAGECYFNPVTAKVELPEVPTDGDDTNDTVDYEWFDYPTGIDTLVDQAGDVIDFLTPLSENGSVVDDANVTVGTMEDEYNLALAVGGAAIHIDVDNFTFTQNYDDSRTQTVYPTRFEDNTSALGAFIGHKANLGLTETPINKRFSTNKSLKVSLKRSQRGSLIDEDVVPLADEPRGVRVVDDPVTVSDSNTDEQNIPFAFSRLLADYIIENVRDNQKPFIGKLNSPTVQNTLQGMVDDVLSNLQQSNAVLSYNVNVFAEDATTVGVEMDADLVEPLRFIENTVTIQ